MVQRTGSAFGIVHVTLMAALLTENGAWPMSLLEWQCEHAKFPHLPLAVRIFMFRCGAESYVVRTPIGAPLRIIAPAGHS
jgi:hypothetical protein